MTNTAAVAGLKTFEDAAARIRVLPSLEPRPNVTNSRETKKILVEALQAVPSWSSPRYGYASMIVSAQEYSFIGEPP